VISSPFPHPLGTYPSTECFFPPTAKKHINADRIASTKNHKVIRLLRPMHPNIKVHAKQDNILKVWAAAVPILGLTLTEVKIVEE
jgi:hypothetical protein